MAEGPAEQPRNILLPVDDHPTTDTLVDWALTNCKGTKNVVQVLHILPVPKAAVGATGAAPGPLYYEVGCPPEAVTKFLMERVTEKLAAAGIKFTVTVLGYRSPTANGLSAIGEAICTQAEAIQADVVVLSKHQRGKIAQLFVGSVTRHCQEHCKRPLVLL